MELKASSFFFRRSSYKVEAVARILEMSSRQADENNRKNYD